MENHRNPRAKSSSTKTVADEMGVKTQGQDSGSYRLLNTNGTRTGLKKEDSGRGEQEGGVIAYVVVTYRIQAVIRA